jgi:hypothetical protein
VKVLNSTKKKIVAAGLAAAVVAGSGIAGAYFTSSGQGTGSATVGSSTKWAVTSDAATAANTLTPGGPSETVAFHIKNNSTGYQQFHTVTIQVAKSVGTSPTATPDVYSHGTTGPACTKDDFTVGTADAGDVETQTLDIELPPGETYDGSVSVAMINRSDTDPGDGLGNQDNCKNEAPPLFFNVQ